MAAQCIDPRRSKEGTGVTMRRKIWCEMVTHAEIAAPNVIEALASRGIGLVVAALPGARGDLARLCTVARERGVDLAIWPMLSDAEGRWASVDNAERFGRYVRDLLEELSHRGICPDEVALDLEPTIERLKRLISLDPRGALDHARKGEERLLDLARELRARSIRVSSALMPLVLFDKPLDVSPGGFEIAMGTPVSRFEWDHASVMMYTSLVEGYSRGLLARADVRPMLARAALEAKRRFGDRAGISLGAVGQGALGDEATYRSVEELADDVAITRAAGVDDLTLFDLGGVLRRPPLEAWLDAFVFTERALDFPGPTWRSRACLGLGLSFSRAIELLSQHRWQR